VTELRLFISSTFRDLQEEREHLVKKIFPEIRALCRQRGITFTEVDLRWGLTEEEAVLGRIVRTCLEEVDRCHPFFLGLFGNTYGWVPDIHEVFMDSELMHRYPWVERAVLDGRSLTELEFIEGVFDPPAGSTPHAWFYRRSAGADADSLPPELQRLIERTRATGHVVHDFSNFDDLGLQVRTDLLKVIDQLWPATDAPTPAAAERRAHAAFAASRTRGFIPRSEYSSWFERWIECGTTPLVVVGESGLGKSSLVASLSQTFRRRNPTAFVIEHYAGVTDPSTTVVGTVRRIVDEIAERFGLESDVPDDPRESEANFLDWLFRLEHIAAENETATLVVIDAINQMEDRAKAMLWVPSAIPGSVRLVLSTTPGEAAAALAGRGWETMTVTPVEDERVRHSIVVRYLGEFHKGIDRRQLQRLTSDDKASSPLYLRVVAEELRLHGLHETVDQLVTHYVGAANLDEVFQRVLQRLERDFGCDDVRSVCSAIWCSRNGLSESELLAVSGVGRLALSRMLYSLDYHLLRRNGLLDFFHDYLRDAVCGRYLVEDSIRSDVHRRIAEHFATTPHVERRRDEEPWQWSRAGESERLHDCLCSAGMFRLLSASENQFELVGYWRSIEPQYDAASSYITAVDLWLEQAASAPDVLILLQSVVSLLVQMSDFEAAHQVAERLMRVARTRSDDDATTAAAYAAMANVYLRQGRYRQSASEAETARSILERNGLQSTAEYREYLSLLLTAQYSIGDFERAEDLAAQALDLAKRNPDGTRLETLNRLHNVAAIACAKGDRDRALRLMHRVVEEYTALLGVHHPQTNRMLFSLGSVLHSFNEPQQAVKCFETSFNHLHGALGDTMGVAKILFSWGVSLIRLGQYPDALQKLEEAGGMQRQFVGENDIDLLDTLTHIALIHIRTGRPHSAGEILVRILPNKAECRGWSHPTTLLNLETFETALLAAGCLARHEADSFREEEPLVRYQRLASAFNQAPDVGSNPIPHG